MEAPEPGEGGSGRGAARLRAGPACRQTVHTVLSRNIVYLCYYCEMQNYWRQSNYCYKSRPLNLYSAFKAH